MGRIIFLGGAPDPLDIDWEREVLSDELLPSFQHDGITCSFRRGHGRDHHRPGAPGTHGGGGGGGDGSWPVWRSIPLDPSAHPLKASFVAESPVGGALARDEAARFLDTQELLASFDAKSGASQGATASFSSDEATADEALDSFLEQSISIEADPDGQHASEEQPEWASTPDPATVATKAAAALGSRPDPIPSPDPLRGVRVTDVRDVPSAARLADMWPHTPTATLVAGVLSAPPPRTVRTLRGRGRLVDLQELIVGDETRAGLGVTLWLGPSAPDAADDAGAKDAGTGSGAERGGAGGARKRGGCPAEALRAAAALLRPRDIVILSNVALAAFRGCVYAQSQRSSSSSHRPTAVVRLLPGCLSDSRRAACHPKVARVAAWVRDFVAPSLRLPPVPDAAAADDQVGEEAVGAGRKGKRKRANYRHEHGGRRGGKRGGARGRVAVLPPDTQ